LLSVSGASLTTLSFIFFSSSSSATGIASALPSEIR
jgi:hypothetical protein